MKQNWCRQTDSAYALESDGFRLEVEDCTADRDIQGWLWSVTGPDGYHTKSTRRTLQEAQQAAMEAARSHAFTLANRMLEWSYNARGLTKQQGDLRTKAFAFLGDKIIWKAYLNDELLGMGPTRDAAIQDAIRGYEEAYGYGSEWQQLSSRNELESLLRVYVAEPDEP